MASRASIGGHPIHPMLIPFPIGLLVFSLIADLIYLWRGNPVWENYIAFYTLLGGIIGAAAAAIPGLIDWATLTDSAAVKVANWHARVNIITLVIFIANFYLRTSGGATWIVGMPMLPIIPTERIANSFSAIEKVDKMWAVTPITAAFPTTKSAGAAIDVTPM